MPGMREARPIWACSECAREAISSRLFSMRTMSYQARAHGVLHERCKALLSCRLSRGAFAPSVTDREANWSVCSSSRSAARIAKRPSSMRHTSRSKIQHSAGSDNTTKRISSVRIAVIHSLILRRAVVRLPHKTSTGKASQNPSRSIVVSHTAKVVIRNYT